MGAATPWDRVVVNYSTAQWLWRTWRSKRQEAPGCSLLLVRRELKVQGQCQLPGWGSPGAALKRAPVRMGSVNPMASARVWIKESEQQHSDLAGQAVVVACLDHVQDLRQAPVMSERLFEPSDPTGLFGGGRAANLRLQGEPAASTTRPPDITAKPAAASILGQPCSLGWRPVQQRKVCGVA